VSNRDERAQKVEHIREVLTSTHSLDRPGGPAESLPVIDELKSLAGDIAFGQIWARPGLDMKTRSIITISVLAALGRSDQLRYHLNGGLNLGLTPEEIVEIIFHVGGYAGLPANNAGQAIVRTVFEDRGILSKP
jgi:4-carboxymuconolactone decarboxylase